MSRTRNSFVLWAPRLLSLAFAAFLSLFALDVFVPGEPILRALVGFAIHLIPVYMVLLTLWIAWRREWVGAVVYAALGIAYIIMASPRFPWQTLAGISGPLFLMAGLFLASWMTGRAARA